MAKKYLDVSGASYPDIKQRLVDYISSQPEFTDYNFQGSALSVLMEILAYNSHINISYSNMQFGESFLNSAVKRANVVSRVKETGYLPRSASAARATVNVSFQVTGNPAQYIIPRGTRFATQANSETYYFVTTEDKLVENVDNVFSATIDIYQGRFSEYTYVVNKQDAAQQFFIPHQMADTRFLSVEIKEAESATEFVQWTDFRDIQLSGYEQDNEIFFLQEDPITGFFEVYFGKNEIGKDVDQGNVIKLTYLFTNGAVVNQAANFVLASTLPSTTGVMVTTISSAVGGAEKQSIESIKFVAPLAYAAQNRAVTTLDYKALMLRDYANIKDVSVWSGRDNVLRYYGRTFIAVRPVTGDNLSPTEKISIQQDMLAKYSIGGITPVLVDADYIYVTVDTIVTYDSNRYTGANTTSLSTGVVSAITTFFEEQVNKFAAPLYYSKLVEAIDESNQVITNSITNLKLEKRKQIIPAQPTRYEFSFNNGITPKSLRCDNLVIDGFTWSLEDVPTGTAPYQTGTLKAKRIQGAQEIVYTTNAGTINYITGEVVIENLSITDIANDPVFQNMIVQVTPGSIVSSTDTTKIVTDYNVYANGREQIIVLKPNSISVTLLPG